MDLDSGNTYSVFNLNLNGDYYLIDRALIPDIGLGWFLGLGGYLRFYHYGSDHANMSYNGLGAGARLPIGLSWQPVDFLEIFADIAPSVGFLSYFGDAAPDKFSFPDGGWQGDIAVRFWF
jgi:hypothetical protein